MLKVQEFNSRPTSSFYSNYLNSVSIQRQNNPNYPKCEPGINKVNLSISSESLLEREFVYSGQKIFNTDGVQDLYLEFSKGKNKILQENLFAYIKASDYLQVKELLPSLTYYSVDSEVDILFGDINDSSTMSISFANKVNELKYKPEPVISKIYPTRYLSINEPVDRFDKIIYINLTQDYSNPLFPGLYFTGRIGLIKNRLFYEYFDYDGLNGPKWSLLFSILRPIGLNAAGPFNEDTDLIKSNCFNQFIGNFPSFAFIADVGEFTGYVTNCEYHPTIRFFLYRKDGKDLALPSPPSPYGKEVFNMIDAYLNNDSSVRLSSESSMYYSVNAASSSYELTLS